MKFSVLTNRKALSLVFAISLMAVLLVAATSPYALGQSASIVSYNMHIRDHGGPAFQVNVGVNVGDYVELTVDCNDTVQGQCFVQAPTFGPIGHPGVKFELKDTANGHQVWLVVSPFFDNAFITAYYWWVGPNVNYHMHILATENIR
jgi:hypothetical protein